VPWVIKKSGGKYCVHKKGEDEPIKCHPTHAAAVEHMQALYVNVGEDKSIIDFDWFYDEESKAVMKKERDGEHPSSHYLVVEDSEKTTTWHLRVKDKNGKIDTRLLGAAHAALTVGYRGNKYEGPDKDKAISKLRELYKQAGLEWPEEKDKKKTFSAMKMYYDEPQMNFYVPYGIHSIADAIATLEAKKEAQEIGQVVHLFQQVVDNIAIDPEVDNKRGAISKAAKELASMIEGELKDDDQNDKSFKAEHMTGVAQDHKHEIMDDMTSSNAGHKHKVKDGKIQMADGHTHSMPEKAIDPSDYLTVKSIGANRVGCYAVLWGDETRKDLTGEWFSPQTEELTAIYDAVGKLPYLYHHGMDASLKTTVIGIVDTLKADSVGLWYEAQLKLAGEYEEYVNKLLADKKLKTSTQTFPVARRVHEKTGHIERWPIVEITATPTPAEYRMQPVDFLKSAYQAVGCADFACLLKTKFGIETVESSGQGAEEARLLAELEQSRLMLLDF